MTLVLDPAALTSAAASSAPLWLEFVAVGAQVVLVLVAIIGVWVASTIPQRISANEIRRQELEAERQSKAMLTSIEAELVKLLAATAKSKSYINAQLENPDPPGIDGFVPFPLRSRERIKLPSPKLIGSPELWVPYVDKEIAESLIEVDQQMGYWDGAMEIVDEDAAAHLNRDFADYLLRLLGDIVSKLQVALARIADALK